jgi:hypothetical protein
LTMSHSSPRTSHNPSLSSRQLFGLLGTLAGVLEIEKFLEDCRRLHNEDIFAIIGKEGLRICEHSKPGDFPLRLYADSKQPRDSLPLREIRSAA